MSARVVEVDREALAVTVEIRDVFLKFYLIDGKPRLVSRWRYSTRYEGVYLPDQFYRIALRRASAILRRLAKEKEHKSKSIEIRSP